MLTKCYLSISCVPPPGATQAYAPSSTVPGTQGSTGACLGVVQCQIRVSKSDFHELPCDVSVPLIAGA